MTMLTKRSGDGGGLQGATSGWVTILGGGINASDGWVVVQTPASFATSGQMEGDGCGKIGATLGDWPYTPFGLIRRDYSPTLDLGSPGSGPSFRYSWKWDPAGVTSRRPWLAIRFYSDSLSLMGEYQTHLAWPGDTTWQTPAPDPVYPAGPNYSAIERIEITFSSVDNSGSRFIPTGTIWVDDIRRYAP